VAQERGGVLLHVLVADGERAGRVEVLGRPRAQRDAVQVLSDGRHDTERTEDVGLRGQQGLLGRQLHDPERQVTDALQLLQHAQGRHEEAQVRRDRRLPPDQVVGPLGERHRHRVDVVVRGQRPRRHLQVAGGEHHPHAGERLAHPHGHDLHLQPQLLELAGEAGAHGAQPNRPVT
jgi:hypothetical protein